MVRLERLGKVNIFSDLSGLEPATSRFVAWPLNHICCRVPTQTFLITFAFGKVKGGGAQWPALRYGAF
jgi:hypothetical protein